MCVCCYRSAGTHTHSHPANRGFTFGLYEKKKRKKKCWELLLSSILVFVFLLLRCMLNEVVPKRYVVTLFSVLEAIC